MIYILLVFSRDFANMIDFQRGLVESQKENSRLANTDSLTGLPNRRQFFSTLEETLARVRPQTLGQASRIPGVTPAALSLLHVYLEVGEKRRAAAR